MDDPVLRVQSQLTDRDRVLLGWLYDHGVLTSFQIAHVLFPSLDFCQRRPPTLHRLRLVARFRPQRADGGSYPYHYVIDQFGAEVVAAARDERPPRRDHARAERRRWTSSRSLAHRLGINSFSPTWPATPVPTRRRSCAGGCRSRRAAEHGPSRVRRIRGWYAPINPGTARRIRPVGRGRSRGTNVCGGRLGHRVLRGSRPLPVAGSASFRCSTADMETLSSTTGVVQAGWQRVTDSGCRPRSGVRLRRTLRRRGSGGAW